MISDFAHDIIARQDEREALERAMDDYLAAGRKITQCTPEPEPEAMRPAWLNNSRRAKLMAVREKRQNSRTAA